MPSHSVFFIWDLLTSRRGGLARVSPYSSLRIPFKFLLMIHIIELDAEWAMTSHSLASWVSWDLLFHVVLLVLSSVTMLG